MRAFPLAALALLASAALAGCVQPPPSAPPGAPGPDLILTNAIVWTGRGDAAEALAIAGPRILAVGSAAEVLALRGPATIVRDLQGGTVLPGFREQHAHLLGVAAGEGEGLPFAPRPVGDDAYEPRHEPRTEAEAEAGRSQIGAYHVATKAAGRSPSDDCVLPPSPVTPALKERLVAMQDAIAAQGLTTAVEAGLADLGVWDALRELEQEGRMKVRFLVRVNWGCLEEAAQRGLRTGSGTEWVKVLGVKMYADGWLGPRTCAVREPYDDRPLWRGVLFLEPERATADVRRARELGFNIGVHTIGDRAMDTMLNAFQAAGVTPEDRWSLEHVQVLAPDLLDRMAALGVIGSMQLSFATSDAPYAERALGAERARWAYAWKSALERGVRLAGGSDFPIEVVNPLWGLQRTVTRDEVDGSLGGWHAEEALGLERALALVTSDAAYASLEDHERGRLAPGLYADLVVLREALLSLPADRIAGATVLLTMANGEVTFEGERRYPPDGVAASGAPPEHIKGGRWAEENVLEAPGWSGVEVAP